MVGQLDRRDVAVGTRDDAVDLPVHDVHAAGSQGIELGVVDVERSWSTTVSWALSWRNNGAVWSPLGWVTIWTMRRSRTS